MCKSVKMFVFWSYQCCAGAVSDLKLNSLVLFLFCNKGLKDVLN